MISPLKFIYSEKATKFCEIFTLLLTACTVVKSKVKISQNCVAFSEFMNFNINILIAFFNGMKLTDSRCFAAWKCVSTNKFVTVSLDFKSSTGVFGRLSIVQTIHVKGWSCDFQIIFSSLDDAEGWGSVDLQKSLW